MVNNLKFLQTYTTPARAVLLKLAQFRHPHVFMLDPDDYRLKGLVSEYRSKHNLPSDLGYMKHLLWFGVPTPQGTLGAAVGFEENYSKQNGLWLYIVDTVCAKGAYREFSSLTKFIMHIPFRLRGIIHVDDGNFKETSLRRGFKLIGWVVEKNG